MQSQEVLEIIEGQENKVRPIIAELFTSILGKDINIEFSKHQYSCWDMIVETKEFKLLVEVKERFCNSDTYEETALDQKKVFALRNKRNNMSKRKPVYIIYTPLFQDNKVMMFDLDKAVDWNKYQFKKVRSVTADINSPIVRKKQYLLNNNKGRVYELLG